MPQGQAQQAYALRWAIIRKLAFHHSCPKWWRVDRSF